MDRHYNLLDIIRVYEAVLVVIIHVGFTPGDGLPELLNKCITGQAVPFFFITSGFFFSRKYIKSDTNIKGCLKYSFNLLSIYFVWQMIYLWPTLHEYTEKYVGGISWITWLLILIRRYFIAGNGPWWFLLVLAKSVIVLKIMTKSQYGYLNFITNIVEKIDTFVLYLR